MPSLVRVNITDIAIIAAKKVDYCCFINRIIKSETTNLLESTAFEICEYTQKILSKFSVHSIHFFFFLLFLFSIYKMVDVLGL